MARCSSLTLECSQQRQRLSAARRTSLIITLSYIARDSWPSPDERASRPLQRVTRTHRHCRTDISSAVLETPGERPVAGRLRCQRARDYRARLDYFVTEHNTPVVSLPYALIGFRVLLLLLFFFAISCFFPQLTFPSFADFFPYCRLRSVGESE